MKATAAKKRSGGIRTTDAQIDNALRAARAREAQTVRITTASFDLSRDVISVTLSNGSGISVPRTAIPGLDTLVPSQITDLAPQSSGLSVWSESADAGVRLETLLAAVSGASVVPLAARIIGSQTSQKKAVAARKNGKKGGRPRTTTKSVVAKK